jgi:hypothetical protein
MTGNTINFSGGVNVQNNNDMSQDDLDVDDEQEEMEEQGGEEDNEEYDEIFNQKKKSFILELDEFQYKHLLKYSAIKEEKCAICLQKYKSYEIIKEFPCKHIFHKNCILKWTKKSNKCPLCKYDITNDVNKMEIKKGEDDEE